LKIDKKIINAIFKEKRVDILNIKD